MELEAGLPLSRLAAKAGVTPQAVSILLTNMRAEATAATTRPPP